MIDPSRGERDADVSLVDEESGGFVGEELRRQRIVDQRREERRPTVWHNDFLVEVITRASGTVPLAVVHRPSARRRLADRLRSELGEDRPRRADARRERVAVILDDIVKLFDQSGGFFV
jgi:hypothetical protein